MLEEIGEQLKTKRQSLGLTLDEIQRHTKIRKRYLVALETGDEESLPAPVFIRGIIRRYCQEVGLDQGLLMEKFDQWRKENEDTSLSEGLDKTPGTGYITLRPADKSPNWRILAAVAVFLVIAASVGAAYYFIILPQADLPLNDGEPEGEPANNESDESEDEPDGGNEFADPPSEGNEQEEEPENEEEELEVERIEGPGENDITYLVSGADELQVTLLAEERCWIEFEVDDEPSEQMMLEAGDEESWSAMSEITITAGNTAGIIVIVNDQDMGIAHETGPRYLYFQFAE